MAALPVAVTQPNQGRECEWHCISREGHRQMAPLVVVVIDSASSDTLADDVFGNSSRLRVISGRSAQRPTVSRSLIHANECRNMRSQRLADRRSAPTASTSDQRADRPPERPDSQQAEPGSLSSATSPIRSATVAAWTRPLTPSFRMIALTCTLAVFGLM